jgi:2-methylisocitrate lyase-like PEP mutase family enzyme
MPTNEAFEAIARLAKNVKVPVTADIEAGYRMDPQELVAHLVGAGAVGCNLEDTDHHGPDELVDLEVHAERLAAVRRAATEAGVHIVINARVDVAIATGERDAKFDEATRRAQAYLQAGADCVYPIYLNEERQIGEFVQLVQTPINIMLSRESPSVARLAELGVARISLAGRLMRRAYAAFRDSLADLKDAFEKLEQGAPPHVNN